MQWDNDRIAETGTVTACADLDPEQFFRPDAMAAAIARGELDYLKHVDSRARWLVRIVERFDLVPVTKFAESVSRGRPATSYEEVLREMLISAEMGEFGRLGPRERVRDLCLLWSEAPPSRHPIRLTALDLRLSVLPKMWARKSVLARWATKRGLPVPPWLEGAKPRRGRCDAPFWAEAKQFIHEWLDDNGVPAKNDGQQAVLERAVSDWLSSRLEVPPGESTVRKHVGRCIAAKKDELGVRGR